MKRGEVLTIYSAQGRFEGIWCQAEDVKRFQNVETFEDLYEGIAYRLMELGILSELNAGAGLANQKLKAATPEQWSQLLLLVTAGAAVSYATPVW